MTFGEYKFEKKKKKKKLFILKLLGTASAWGAWIKLFPVPTRCRVMCSHLRRVNI